MCRRPWSRFAVAPVDADRVISPEFKNPGNTVVLVPLIRDAAGMPDFAAVNQNFDRISALISERKAVSARTVRLGGVAAAVSTMAFGNQIGFEFAPAIPGKCCSGLIMVRFCWNWQQAGRQPK